MKAKRSLFTPLYILNSKSVTKLVLLAEIIAICILHSFKLNHVPKPPQDNHTAYDVEKKLMNAFSSVKYTEHR